jgi:hypothetical protein
MSLSAKSIEQDLVKSDERTRTARAKRAVEFQKPFQKLSGICVNSHSGAIWNAIQEAWENGSWIATVILCDLYCRNQLRGLYRYTFEVEPSEDYHDLVNGLTAPEVRVITEKTADKILQLARLRRYYDQPFGTAMMGTPYRAERDKGEFIEDFSPRDAEAALETFHTMQIDIGAWCKRLTKVKKTKTKP